MDAIPDPRSWRIEKGRRARTLNHRRAESRTRRYLRPVTEIKKGRLVRPFCAVSWDTT